MNTCARLSPVQAEMLRAAMARHRAGSAPVIDPMQPVLLAMAGDRLPRRPPTVKTLASAARRVRHDLAKLGKRGLVCADLRTGKPILTDEGLALAVARFGRGEDRGVVR